MLDSSACLALFEDEAGADIVKKLLEQAKKGEIVVFTSFLSFMEVFYITFREKDEKDDTNRLMTKSKKGGSVNGSKYNH